MKEYFAFFYLLLLATSVTSRIHQLNRIWPCEYNLTENSLRCLDWNPLGTLVATGSLDKTLRVWNPDRPNIKYSTELKGHEASVEKVAFNPVKDAELCSLSANGVLKLWDVRTKGCVNEVTGLGDAFTCVWEPDGREILVGNKVSLFQDPGWAFRIRLSTIATWVLADTKP